MAAGSTAEYPHVDAHDGASTGVDSSSDVREAASRAPTADRAPENDSAVGHKRGRSFAFGVFLVALPGLLFYLLGVRDVEPINGQDGYLYVGIAARMSDFLARFPDSYYGVRFGHLFPSLLFTRLFGFEFGYFLWRFLLLGWICLLLRADRSIRAPQAVLAAVVVSTSPILLVSSFSTYTLSTSVLTFVVGSTLLAVHRVFDLRSQWRIVLAGALFAVSWNANLATLPVCVLVSFAFLVDQVFHTSERRTRNVMYSAASFAAGTLAIVLPAILIYGYRFGIWNIFEPTLAQARKPTSDLFLEPGWHWISWRHYLLIGPLSMVVSVSAWLTEPNQVLRAFLRRFSVFSTLSVILFAFLQWVQNSPLLAIYFYSAIPLGLCTVSLAFALAVVLGRAHERWVAPFALAVVLLVTGAFVLGSRWGAPFALLAIAAAVLAGLTIFGAWHRWLFVVGTAGVVLVSSWSVVSSPHDFPASPGGYRTDPYYDGVLFSYDDASMDRAKIVHELSSLLPSLPAERGELLVWFDSTGPFDQLSAPFLWYRSGLQSPVDGPMPELTETVRSRVVDRRPRFIVIIDGDEADALKGVEELTALAPYAVVLNQVIDSGDTAAHVVLLERESGTWLDFPCDDPSSLQPRVCP